MAFPFKIGLNFKIFLVLIYCLIYILKLIFTLTLDPKNKFNFQN